MKIWRFRTMNVFARFKEYLEKKESKKLLEDLGGSREVSETPEEFTQKAPGEGLLFKER